MEITGTIINVLPLESGTSKAGKEFSKITFVLQYEESSQYPKQVAITLINKHCQDNMQRLRQGARVNVKFDVTSREYNGRWYTEAVGWRVEDPQAQAPAQTYAPQAPYGMPQAPAPMPMPMPGDKPLSF